MAKDPKDRYNTIDEFAAAVLQEYSQRASFDRGQAGRQVEGEGQGGRAGERQGKGPVEARFEGGRANRQARDRRPEDRLRRRCGRSGDRRGRGCLDAAKRWRRHSDRSGPAASGGGATAAADQPSCPRRLRDRRRRPRVEQRGVAAPRPPTLRPSRRPHPRRSSRRRPRRRPRALTRFAPRRGRPRRPSAPPRPTRATSPP